MNKSFLKWAGGKSQLVDKVISLMPPESFNNGSTYFEPFVGSGVIALNVPHSKIVISDINPHLIGVWRALKNWNGDYIDECRCWFDVNRQISKYNTEKMYYELRTRFNNNAVCDSPLFLYLNRHCFNGLCRYNSKGEFNVPYGHYKKVYFPEEELKYAAEKAQKMGIYHNTFSAVIDTARDGDVVYCDPPYIPRSEKSNFTAYAKGGFGMEEQVKLVKCAIAAQKAGATVIISNTDCPIARSLYATAEQHYVDVRKSISCKANGRVKQGEIIAVYRPK